MNLLWFYQHVLRCGCGWYAPRHSKCLQRLSQNFKHLMNCRHKTVTCPNLQKYPTKWGWVTMINLRNRYKWININIHVYCMCIYIYLSLWVSICLNIGHIINCGPIGDQTAMWLKRARHRGPLGRGLTIFSGSRWWEAPGWFWSPAFHQKIPWRSQSCLKATSKRLRKSGWPWATLQGSRVMCVFIYICVYWL